MNLGKKLQGILSLAAASLALLDSTKAKELIASGTSSGQSVALPVTSTLSNDLLLTPPHQEEINKLYAGHSSHSSHASHSSHYSGSSYSATLPGYTTSSNGEFTVTPQLNPPVAVQPVYPPTLNTNDPVVAKRIFEARIWSAARGLPSYQYELGLMYLAGNGVEKDENKGKFYLELAAQQGHGEAMKRLKTLKSSEPEATQANKTSATNDVALETGSKEEIQQRDSKKEQINKLMQKAADGSADAQYDLGMRYVAGDGVTKDLTSGRLLLEMAATQGKAEATGALRLLNSNSK